MREIPYKAGEVSLNEKRLRTDSLKFMKPYSVRACVVAVLLLPACSPPTPPPAPPAPAATPAKEAPTPYPAKGATEQALKLYPDLAKTDSIFNHTFRDLYQQRLKESPEWLTRATWPLDLARETAGMLGVPEATGTPLAASTPTLTWFQQKQRDSASPLDSPAYNQQQAAPHVYNYGPVYDSNGTRIR